MASDVSEPTPLVGQPRLLQRGIVAQAFRERDGMQSVNLVEDGPDLYLYVAPIEYTIQPGDLIAVYGEGTMYSAFHCIISHVRINDGPATPQLAGYLQMVREKVSRA